MKCSRFSGTTLVNLKRIGQVVIKKKLPQITPELERLGRYSIALSDDTFECDN